MTTLVVDANVVFEMVAAPDGVRILEGEEAGAPPLLWPEVRSALHLARWRGLLDDEDASQALEVMKSGALRERRHRRLGAEAWRIADELQWVKTYDAEYLALASLLGVPLASFDRRVLRGAERLGIQTHSFA
ncbi:MAG: type II toxin-antitoxin system VapC family toxin [Actinomycetota bacterium]